MMNKSRLFPSSRLCVFALACVASAVIQIAAGEEPQGTEIRPGATVNLFKAWPEIATAPKSKLATIECLIKPDAAAIARPRSFIMTLSNRSGSDVAGLGLALQQGVLSSNVFGVKLVGSKPLRHDRWTHVALTINTSTVNKLARLWIDGKLVAEELVLQYWPTSFEVAEMLSDKWGQGREFSGELSDVRISNTVRYETPFDPPARLAKDDNTVLLLEGERIPLSD